MADAPEAAATPTDEQLRALCDETYSLVRRVSSGVRRLSVRAGDCAVEIEWDPTAMAAAPAPSSAAVDEAADVEAVTGDQHVLTAPLVGTFYRSPEPGAKPFVEEGSVVEAGQDVAIIEAMKIMNKIQAERGGKVTKILATDAELVEFGQELMAIEPYDDGGE